MPNDNSLFDLEIHLSPQQGLLINGKPCQPLEDFCTAYAIEHKLNWWELAAVLTQLAIQQIAGMDHRHQDIVGLVNYCDLISSFYKSTRDALENGAIATVPQHKIDPSQFN